jgi:hypothetical protein
MKLWHWPRTSFRHDILTVAGLCYSDCCNLYDFVVAKLRARASKCPHRLEPICRVLQNQRDDLLAFAHRLDEDLEQLGQMYHWKSSAVGSDDGEPSRWRQRAE